MQSKMYVGRKIKKENIEMFLYRQVPKDLEIDSHATTKHQTQKQLYSTNDQF